MVKTNKYKVYKILHDDEIIYIGRTNNLKRRTYQHNYNLKKGKENQLYDYCRRCNIDTIELITIDSFKKKVESKRMEMFIILQHHFSSNKLQQKVPNISDR